MITIFQLFKLLLEDKPVFGLFVIFFMLFVLYALFLFLLEKVNFIRKEKANYHKNSISAMCLSMFATLTIVCVAHLQEIPSEKEVYDFPESEQIVDDYKKEFFITKDGRKEIFFLTKLTIDDGRVNSFRVEKVTYSLNNGSKLTLYYGFLSKAD